MRKRHRVLILAAIVAALAVPLGFALSLESTATSVITPQMSEMNVVAASAKSASMFVDGPTRQRRFVPVPDAAKLLFIGTALFGIAAAMRRTPQ